MLEEASDPIGHETPRTTLPEIQVRALRALVQELRARKRAASRKPPPPVPVAVPATGPTPAKPPQVGPDAAPEAAPEAAPARRGARHVPASVRRAVFDRDGARCSYQDDRGERCRATLGLEVHHRHPHALGGPPTLDNLELRCRPHNTLAAEQHFGRDYVDFVRGVTGGAALESPERR